jgi:hypothetical protein
MGSNYAGVDWASEKHDVLIADETGEELLAATFAHDEVGLRSLCRTLAHHKVALVAIERPDGLLVERLLDAGLRVLALHPNQVGVSEEPCKRGRKDQPCLRELTAASIKKTLSARSEATSEPESGERCFPGCRAVPSSVRSRWSSATSC